MGAYITVYRVEAQGTGPPHGHVPSKERKRKSCQQWLLKSVIVEFIECLIVSNVENVSQVGNTSGFERALGYGGAL